MRHFWNFKHHSPADYRVILPQRWTKLPLKSMVIFIFLKFGMVKVFETLQTISNMKMNIFQIKISHKITLLLFMIYSFIKFKVLVVSLKVSMVHLAWECIAIGLLTMQLITVQLGKRDWQYSQCSTRFHCLHFLRGHMAWKSRSQRTTLMS